MHPNNSPQRSPSRSPSGYSQQPLSPEAHGSQMTSPNRSSRGSSPQQRDASGDRPSSTQPLETSTAGHHVPTREEIQTMVASLPKVVNPLGYLARMEPMSPQANDFLTSAARLQRSVLSRTQRPVYRDTDELMHENMRQSMHASRVDQAMRAHAERLEALGFNQPAPNSRTLTGAFGPQSTTGGGASGSTRRDTPAPWVQIQSLGVQPREPSIQDLNRDPAQPFHNRPAPHIQPERPGDAFVTPEIAEILTDLRSNLLDAEGHFIPSGLASAYRAGIINDNDQIKPTFVGWLELAHIPCHVKPDGHAYLGYEITSQPSLDGAGPSRPPGCRSPPRSPQGDEHPILHFQGLPALAGGITLSSAQLPPDMAAKLESLRKRLLYEGTDSFIPEGIEELRQIGALDSDQISPQLVPWLKAAEVPVVFDSDQKAYLGNYDGRSARTTGLGKEWKSWYVLAQDSRKGAERNITPFFAAAQLLRLPPPPENIDMGHLTRTAVRNVQGLKDGLLDASGQFIPLGIAEFHRLGIIDENRKILEAFVPWLRAADVPLIHDPDRNMTRLDSDAARAVNYGRHNYRNDNNEEAQERLDSLIDGAAKVQLPSPPPPSDQRNAPVANVPAEPDAAAAANAPARLMNPIAREAFERILNRQNLWADPGQPAAEGGDGTIAGPQVEEGHRSPRAPGQQQDVQLFGPDPGPNQPRSPPRPRNPEAEARAQNVAARQGIQAADNRLNRVARDIFGFNRMRPFGRQAGAPVGGNVAGPAGQVRAREQEFEPPQAQRLRIDAPPVRAVGQARPREQDFEPPPARRQRRGSPEPARPRQGQLQLRGAAQGPAQDLAYNFDEHLEMINESIKEMDLKEQGDNGLPGYMHRGPRHVRGFLESNNRERAQRGHVHRGPRHTQDLHKDSFESYRNPLRKDIAHYTQFPALNRIPNIYRTYIGEGICGMICELWPDDHSPIPNEFLYKCSRMNQELQSPPHYVFLEHMGTDLPEECVYYLEDDEPAKVTCACWLRRVGDPYDPRGPLLLKRLITAAAVWWIRQKLPPQDGEPQRFRWSREHNDLFFSWLYHYGEEHDAGRDYNCAMAMERILEFKAGTGLYGSAINSKLQDWAAAVHGWQSGLFFVAQQEGRMQYNEIKDRYNPIEEWIMEHPHVESVEAIPGHVMEGWERLAIEAGETEDLDLIVSDYVMRQRFINERDSFYDIIRAEKEHVVLRTLEEINYEILPARPEDPAEYVSYNVLVDATPAMDMPHFADFFGDGRPPAGFDTHPVRAMGRENLNPDLFEADQFLPFDEDPDPEDWVEPLPIVPPPQAPPENLPLQGPSAENLPPQGPPQDLSP
ncbi:hypothetical protein R1flu_026638 [Riccia fluitans]|uniref:Uncharacterized protein n=1 Tax=Riccia fluitans TaxID=41844 RepID=A0ABD1XH13_9MARC